MISLTLSDTSGASVVYGSDQIESGFEIEQLDGKSTNTTLSGNVYTDFIYKKKQWTVSFAWMSSDKYDELLGFYDRQFTLYKYPTAQIVTPSGTVTAVVAMEINARNITSHCGTVENITVTLRESDQI